MGAETDAMMVVRAELCARLESLQRLSRASSADFLSQIDSIRLTAAAYGLTPVARLAEALERAIAESDKHSARECPTGLYLDRLRDAIGCGRNDDMASQAMLASVSVRMGA